MVEPRLGILVPSTLELEVGVLAKVRRKFGEPVGIHIVKFLLILQIPKHSHAFNGGKTSFNQEDKIGNITSNPEVVAYKLLMDQLNCPL